MLRTTKNMKDKYEKIQTLLFSLIPEKWEEIYLYASVITTFGNSQTGELFFYYLPKGILKKKPINVYEVPSRFNINEEQYLKVVKELYECIKELKQDFIDTEQDLWTNLTISINNIRFRVDYNYDKLPSNENESEKNRIIWRYKYLKIGGEKKEERKILDEYFSRKNKRKDEIYEAGLNVRTENTGVRFDREEIRYSPQEVVKYIKDDEYQDEEIQKKEKNKKEELNIQEEKKTSKNQILNI